MALLETNNSPEDATDPSSDMAAKVREAGMWSDARGLRHLDFRDVVMICLLLPQLAFVRLLLSTRGYAKTYSLMQHRSGKKVPLSQLDQGSLRRAVRAGRVVNSLAHRLPFDAKCLVRSLTVWGFLRRHGIPAELKIGVASNETFQAHAWVELFGEPITDTQDAVRAFAPFDRSGP